MPADKLQRLIAAKGRATSKLKAAIGEAIVAECVRLKLNKAHFGWWCREYKRRGKVVEAPTIDELYIVYLIEIDGGGFIDEWTSRHGWAFDRFAVKIKPDNARQCRIDGPLPPK